jgi:hypothetical protein
MAGRCGPSASTPCEVAPWLVCGLLWRASSPLPSRSRIAGAGVGLLTLALTGKPHQRPCKGALRSRPIFSALCRRFPDLGCEPRRAQRIRPRLLVSPPTSPRQQGSASHQWRPVSGAGRERRPPPSHHGASDRRKDRAGPEACSRLAKFPSVRPPLELPPSRDCAFPFVDHRFCDRVP